jgi:tRNA(Ser,Leu) C12 N-acetylase TAN1
VSDWNVVVSLQERGFKKAFKDLQGFGIVSKTEFFNVLTMKVSDIERFQESLLEWVAEHPALLKAVARLVPITATFSFQSAAEFETQAKETVLQWVPQLAGKAFHVRMHRRGFKERISSLEAEHLLDGTLLAALAAAGTPGRITFEEPDAIVIVETLGQWAGLACWQRQEMQRYPWLRLN